MLIVGSMDYQDGDCGVDKFLVRTLVLLISRPYNNLANGNVNPTTTSSPVKIAVAGYWVIEPSLR